ncbi:Cytochrome P450 CYP72A219-like protein [Drosera capensis]
METLFTVGIPLACIVALTWTWRLFEWVWLKPKALEKQLRQQGLSGNPYRFLYGDTNDRATMALQATSKPIALTDDYVPRVIPFQYHTIKKHGNHAFMWNGPTPVVFITEPELIREVFNKYRDYQKPKVNPLVELLAPGFIQFEGDKWAQHRKLMNPAFHVEKLKLMLPAFYASCKELVNKWEKIVTETGSHELDVSPYLTTLTADVISRAAFGSSFEEGRRIFTLLREQTNIVTESIHTLYVPGQRYLPTRTNKRMKELNIEIQSLLKGIIYKRKRDMEAGKPAKDDLLGILLESSFQELRNQAQNKKQHIGLTVKEVIDECKLFYFAGQETTSVLLSWTMILLAKHQDWQERAREEVLTTFGKSKPTFNGLNHLKTVTMILHEVLRLYSPVTELQRKTDHDIQLGDLLLPAGIIVSTPIIFPHYNPKFWGEDVKEFNPERFSDGISKATNGNNSFFPFGWGPRICIGQNFALAEAKLALTMVLQRFAFQLSPSYVHAPIMALLLVPQHGIQLILERI